MVAGAIGGVFDSARGGRTRDQFDDSAGGVEPTKGFVKGCGGRRSCFVKQGPPKELWKSTVVCEFVHGAVYLFLIGPLGESRGREKEGRMGVVVEILKRQSRLPSLFVGVAIAANSTLSKLSYPSAQCHQPHPSPCFFFLAFFLSQVSEGLGSRRALRADSGVPRWQRWKNASTENECFVSAVPCPAPRKKPLRRTTKWFEAQGAFQNGRYCGEIVVVVGLAIRD